MYMAQRISQSQIQDLQRDVLNIVSKVDRLKHSIRTEDTRQILNHLQYTLSVLRNMSNSEKVAPASSSFSERNYGPAKVVYNPDGTTRIIHTKELHTTGDGWEGQFDESLLIRPPSYIAPPQSKTYLGRQ